MRRDAILSLSSVLFKSYFRASRQGGQSPLSKPVAMLALDAAAFVVPSLLLSYGLPLVPGELRVLLAAAAHQLMVGLPLFVVSAVIVSGILFELGQGQAISSSGAANWLPLSPEEYVLGSTLSVGAAYSLFPCLGLGVALPLAATFGALASYPLLAMMAAVALMWGGFVVEALRAATNRVSVTVYRRGGRLGMVSRLVLLVVMFVAVQLAFNPYVLYSALGAVASGVGLLWFVPMVWPSASVMYALGGRPLEASAFLSLSLLFSYALFGLASRLRSKYWSPVPVTVRVARSSEYEPQSKSMFGVGPVEMAIAYKEFRSLLRRKDMARFLAIPALMTVSFLIPLVTMPGRADYGDASPGLSLIFFLTYLLSLMFSMISIGQEGRSISNIYMLPISATQLMVGKLLPAWVVSLSTMAAVFLLVQATMPVSTEVAMVALLAAFFVILVESFIGLGVGARYPDFTVGPRSGYVTFTGFLIGFVMGALAAAAIFLPLLVQVLLEGMRPSSPFSLGPTVASILTALLGSTLAYVTYGYCRSGVEKLLSDLKA